MRLVVITALTTAACAGCGGDDGGSTDGRPADAASVDGALDAPSCTGSQAFTGELVDFNSSPTAFQGVFGAVFTRRGEPGCTASTAPNGRFILSIPSDAGSIFDVDAPDPYLDGIWPVDGGLASGATFSGRALSDADLTALGVTPDPARAQVLLYQDGPGAPVPLVVTGASDAYTTVDGTTWAPGNDESYILFTNVTIGTGVQTLMDATFNTVPVGEIRVEAGVVTYITTRQIPE